MSTQNSPLNTSVIQQFIAQVKSADAGQEKEIKMNIHQAKNLAFTLGIVMSRLNGDLEAFISKKTNEEVVSINMDGGAGW